MFLYNLIGGCAMKRTTTLLMAITMMIVMAANVWAQHPTKFSDQQIWGEVWRIADLNPQIRNLDKINVGDTVVVDTVNGKTIYIVEPWAIDGQLGDKGCLWKIAGSHLIGQLKTIPPVVAINSAETKTGPVENSGDGIPALGWWILSVVAIVLMIIIVIALRGIYSGLRTLRKEQYTETRNSLYEIRNHQENRASEIERLTRLRREVSLNMENGTPMIAGGVSDNPTVALTQISRMYDNLFYDPNRIVKKVERGHLDGSKDAHVIAPVWYREGVRRVMIPTGTNCYRVTVGHRDNPDYERFEYVMKHCGNLVGEVSDGRFELPEGWTFIVDTDDKKNPIQATAEPEVSVTPIVSKETAGGSGEENPGSNPKNRITITRDHIDSKLDVQTSRYPTRIISNDDGSYIIDLS